jgi:drug/metabolite transporter superfamily protein YnfA
METINKSREKGLPVLNKNVDCNFEGYDASLLMSETAKFIIPTLQPSHFGRTYAAYGGIFITSSIIWGMIVDKKKPDRFEITGSLVAICGAIIIFYSPR